MPVNEPIAFFNGQLLPETNVGISIRDRGFLYGDAVFDATRTFHGKTFKLEEHVDRLFNSLQYLRIDPRITKDELIRWSLKVVEHNYPLLPDGQDLWVMQRISRGLESSTTTTNQDPTILIESHAIPFAKRANLYRDGIRLITPSTPRIPPRFISPRAKTHNYLNLIMGELEAQSTDPESWAVLLDENGNFTEGKGSNIFLIKNGIVSTPGGQFVLEGITRETVLNLASGLGFPISEGDLDLYDGYTADEAFLTSTSLCICPITSINGSNIGKGTVPGPITNQLMVAFSDLTGTDYVSQYLNHLP